MTLAQMQGIGLAAKWHGCTREPLACWLSFSGTNVGILPSHGRFRGVRSLCADILYFE